MDVYRLARIALVREEVETVAIPIEHLGHVDCLTAECVGAYGAVAAACAERSRSRSRSSPIMRCS
jgi:hypothetical protein